MLLHVCCANCALYPVQSLLSRGVEIKALWFNPNIHLEDEYSKRLSALRTLEALWSLDVEYIDEYGIREFLRAVQASDADRCSVCYAMRLDKTAQTARQMGIEAFSTTLLVSPYQKIDLIKTAGEEAGRRHGVSFFFEDFRPGYREGVAMSKQMGLYRQKYCGCIYSKKERGLHGGEIPIELEAMQNA